MKDIIIAFQDFSYRYPRSKNYALHRINLEVHRGEFLAVMGESGAGKTTLCKCINGVIPYSEGGRLRGTVIITGLDTQKASIARLSQKVGIVLDDPDTQLFTTKVKNEIAFGPENLNYPVKTIQETVSWALKVVKLEGFEERPPSSLSGGQKQRLAIAAALAMRPEVLILDEPTSHLDPVSTSEIFEIIRKLNQKYRMTIVIATHKSEEIARFADKICVLKKGKLLAYDTPDRIFRDKELLREAWIRPPQVSQLADYLVKGGLPVHPFPILEEQAVEMVLDLIRGEENGKIRDPN